jgi:hypothetical protein
MIDFIKKNLVVLIAFALPIILILSVTMFLYLPGLFVSTNYNFVYAICSNTNYYYGYECNNLLQQKYSVVNNKLVLNDVPLEVDVYGNKRPISTAFESRVFLHNTKTNESRELSTAEEMQLFLESDLYTSPDGVTLSRSSSGGEYFFPFGGSSYSTGWYLTKGRNKKKMNLINDTDRYYYQDGLRVLGWVK